MILSNKRIIMALIRLRGCAGWSVPLLLANAQRQVFSRRGPYCDLCTCRVATKHIAIDLIKQTNIASAMVIYVSKLPLGACSIRACSISKLRKCPQQQCLLLFFLRLPVDPATSKIPPLRERC